MEFINSKKTLASALTVTLLAFSQPAAAGLPKVCTVPAMESGVATTETTFKTSDPGVWAAVEAAGGGCRDMHAVAVFKLIKKIRAEF